MSSPVTILHPTAPPKAPQFRTLFLRLQDNLFDGLADLLAARDRLAMAAKWDDQESEIEAEVFGDMRRCPCRCCGRHLPRLLRADGFDHQERFSGHALALVKAEDGAAFFRAASTLAESGRLAAIGSKQLRRFGLAGPDGDGAA